MNIIGYSGLDRSVSFKKTLYPDLDRRCYRICQGFDSAAAIVDARGIQAAAAEERFTRQKTTGAFPINAIRYCLKESGLSLSDIDCIAHGFNYETHRDHYDWSEETKQQFREVYSRQAQTDCLEQHLDGWRGEFIQVPHHLAHAASTYYLSGLQDALVVVADGMGEQESLTVGVGRNGDIEVLTQIPSIHSLGILYSVFTLYLGFNFNLDEYKVMGLAPYGNPRRQFDKMMGLIKLQPDGTYRIPLLFANQSVEEKETYAGCIQQLEELFGPARIPGSEVTRNHQDIAAALQSALQTALLHLLRAFRKETGIRNLCLAGGVALNCSANGVIKRSRLFKNMFVQPASGDDGSALGAAIYVKRQRDPGYKPGRMSLPLWGPEFSDEEMREAIAGQPACQSTHFPDEEALLSEAADRLNQGQIVGWFQGRMEFGPRALGGRSILADPRQENMRDRINALVKKREDFRPFAPAVAAEAAARFFAVDEGDESLFDCMLCVAPVRDEFRDKLPAITHVDGSARLQTVNEKENERFWKLLQAFERSSGIPILLNTSFNVMGQPIVCNPTEAVETFLVAGLDALVMGHHLIVSRDQA